MTRTEELDLTRHEALGYLLGITDAVILALENPKIVTILEVIHELRGARDAYSKAAKDYLDERLKVTS